jgi:hypothetical protein
VGALVRARSAATPRLRDEILGAAGNKLLEARGAAHVSQRQAYAARSLDIESFSSAN